MIPLSEFRNPHFLTFHWIMNRYIHIYLIQIRLSFLLEKATWWIEVFYFSLKLERAVSLIKQVLYFSLKKKTVKNFSIMDLYLINTQLFASQYVNWWTRIMWIIVMFHHLFGLSFWRHPFTTEDPFVSKLCNDTFIITNSSTSWMALGWVHFQQILLWGVNYSFNGGWTFLLFLQKLMEHCITI